MNATTEPLHIDVAQAEIEQLHHRCRSLILSTLDEHRQPEVSYAPFVHHHSYYYIFVSGLSPHTRALQAHPEHVSLLIIEDEADSRNIYARSRLSYQAVAHIIERHSDECISVLKQMHERLGNTVDLLAQLGDFVMVRLMPRHGTLIMGVGKTYVLDAEHPSIITPITPEQLKNR